MPENRTSESVRGCPVTGVPAARCLLLMKIFSQTKICTMEAIGEEELHNKPENG
uniref:Uncharacterized protein n=1 Tax=Candidatus Kentrum sp. FW TaxID=2126338 RepID=A0A450S7J6_9GAMM|nr:MAG: hypothetical protein BECKFW1821A_GA0114235_101323 [Candidatus Kentron sp. FW]VFJ47846.1 MAG: hypothetical protein BECKFW1821B_GA0114236_100331 [Candidatus Kentron sp. FW]